MVRKLKPIPDELIINKLQIENCWWETGKIDSVNSGFTQRLYFKLFYKLVEETDVNFEYVIIY